MEQKATARDFFLHLGSIVALYVVVGNFINLLFRIIDKAFPAMVTNAYYWTQGSEISFPVATLIVVFPIFVILSWLTHKTYDLNPEKKGLGVRKWLTYVTLFLAGIFLAGDLVTVLYKFLDGQDLTTAFLLKALAVLIVSGAVFGFYLQDIRERISSKQRRVWAIIIAVLILVSIVLGFSVIGSPKNQRLLREDNQTLNDLQNIESQVINYWMVNGKIPESMPSLYDVSINVNKYEYRKTGEMTFEICGNFNLSNFNQPQSGIEKSMPSVAPWDSRMVPQKNNWNHEEGRQCFDRTIDPVLYPTQVRG